MKRAGGLVAAVLVLLVLACGLYRPVSVWGETGESVLFSDGETKLYLARRQGELLTLRSVNAAGRQETFQLEGVGEQEYLTVPDGLLLASNHDGTVMLTEILGSRKYVHFIEGTAFASGCIAVGEENRLYLTEASDGKRIRRFERLCEERESVTLPEKAAALFCAREDRRVYAIAARGIYDAESGRLISCEVPALPVRYSGGYYSDSKGQVFTFNAEKGFAKCLDTGYGQICTTEQAVFVLESSGKAVRMHDFEGKLQGTYRSGCVITAVTATRKLLGLLTDSGELVTIDSRDFEPAEPEQLSAADGEPENRESRPREQENDPRDSREPSQEAEPSKVPAPSKVTEPSKEAEPEPGREESSGGFSVSSDVYRIEKGWLREVPQGTTVAGLKEGLSCGGAVITAIDHHGRRGAVGKAGTGWRIEIDSGEETRTLTVIVDGDLTGEGNINLLDLRLLAKCLNEEDTLSDAAEKAADLNGDGRLGIADLYLLQRCTYGL